MESSDVIANKTEGRDFANARLTDICSLSIFSSVGKIPLIAAFEKFLRAWISLEEFTQTDSNPAKASRQARRALTAAARCGRLFAEERGADWFSLIARAVIQNENPFTLAAESGERVNEAITQLAKSDIAALERIARIRADETARLFARALRQANQNEAAARAEAFADAAVKDGGERNERENEVPILTAQSDWSEKLLELTAVWKNGAGIFGAHKFFVWERGSVIPALSPDPVRVDDLAGYNAPRSIVIENTRRFVSGVRANNLLLYGDRGSGKSTTVKAVVREFAAWGARLIEVRKKDLPDFSHIVAALRGRNLKFVVFIDDLSFERADQTYTALKALLEGGVEEKPKNIVLYATTNRRHLVKEMHSDRSGALSANAQEEVRAFDSMQEQLSLSDRFGVTVYFSSPSQEEYLEIVNFLLQKRGITLDPEKVKADALRWEKWYNGRSPRTARQFADWLEAGEKAPWDYAQGE